MQKVFCSILLAFLAFNQVISEPLVINETIKKDTINLVQYLKYLTSSSSDTIKAIPGHADINKLLSSDPIGLYNTYNYFTFELIIDKSSPENLVFQFPKLDYVHLQIFSKGVEQRSYFSGELVPYTSKSIPYNRDGYEEIRIDSEPGYYTCILMIRDRNLNTQIDKVYVLSFENWKKVLHDYLSFSEVTQGVFHGALLSMVLFFIYYYFITRDKSGIQFMISSLAMSAFMLISFGFIPPLFPSVNPKYLIILTHFLLIVSLFGFISFLSFFSEIKVKYTSAKRILTISKRIIYILFLGTLLFIFSDNYIDSYYFSRIVVDSCIIIVWLTYTVYIYVKSKENKIIVTSSLVAIIGFFITLIQFTNTPEDPIIYFPLQIGFMIAMISISFIIIERYRLLRTNENLMQAKLIDEMKKSEELQRDQNERLENEVKKRTEEISAQNKELIKQQKELATHRDTLTNQSRIIEQKNNELLNYNLHLEENVQLRTQQLNQINTELVEQNQQLEQFSNILAHNLKSPVARLLGLTHLYKITDKNEHTEIIDRISSSATDLSEVLKDVNTMLEIKNTQGPVKTKISIDLMVNKCLNRFDDQIENLKIKIIKDIKLDEIVTVNAYLESIILNLISNAIKYRKANGEHQIKISSRKKNSKLELIVEDNGIGINLKEHKSKLFGMYQRFHDHIEGKGLGLYLVKAQIDTLQGEIKIWSEIDKGTKFTVLMPL